MTLDRRALLLTLLLPLGSALWPVQAMAKGGEGRGGDDGDDDDDGGGGGGGDDRGDDDDDNDNSGHGGEDDDRDDDDRDSDDDDSSNAGNNGGGTPRAAPSRSGGGTSPRDRLPTLKPGQYRITRKGRVEALTQGQFNRLLQGGTQDSWSQLVQIGPNRVTVTDSAGWREEFGSDRYRLLDPRGNLVTRRPLTRKDTARLRQLLGG